MVSKRASLGVHRRRGGRGEGLNQWMSFEMKVKNENFAGCVSSQCQLGLNGAASFHHDGGPESYRTWIKLCFYKEAIKYRKVAGVYMAKYGCLCLSLIVAKSSQSCLFCWNKVAFRRSFSLTFYLRSYALRRSNQMTQKSHGLVKQKRKKS